MWTLLLIFYKDLVHIPLRTLFSYELLSIYISYISAMLSASFQTSNNSFELLTYLKEIVSLISY